MAKNEYKKAETITEAETSTQTETGEGKEEFTSTANVFPPKHLGTPHRDLPSLPSFIPGNDAVLGLNLDKFLIQAFDDDLAVVTTDKARWTLEIETNSILDQISNKLKNLKLVISHEKTFSVAFRCTARGDHFAKVATTNGIERSFPAPRSYVIKTLQNKLRTGRVVIFPLFRFRHPNNQTYDIVVELLTFCTIFAVTLTLIHSNSLYAQLAIPNDSRYGQLETNLGIEQAKEGSNRVKTVVLHPCRVRPIIALLKKDSWEPLHEWQHMWLQDVMDIPLGCHGATDHTRDDRLLKAMVPHTITPAVRVVCRCKAKAGLSIHHGVSTHEHNCHHC
ncbi:hypothetical protein TNCV_5137361 [Trichonephila clavipes]|nr:hypothetical protein TNCV_5137361 [Trichonephila clavipes]